MKRADTTIAAVYPGSIAERLGIAVGDKLLKINNSEFYDVLEYRYLISESELLLTVEKADGRIVDYTAATDYEDIGIEFKSELIDDAKSCRNKCIFCFIDQLPKGMRDTVYFKDDDTRLSFLQGNYVTLTNMSDEEIDRMIKIRISPINISVHTTNPELRRKMLGNRFAGKVLDIMKKFAANGILMNGQIVACPGYNDGAELERTMLDLADLYPYMQSVSVVPVGLTRYREGLCQLQMYTKQTAGELIDLVEKYQQIFLEKYGTRLIYLSDEFYINADRPLPDAPSYEGFPQIENGVGLAASLFEEFDAAIELVKPKKRHRHVVIATGELIYPFIRDMAKRLSDVSGVRIDVYAIRNDFFGGGVNVTGLICGSDIIAQLKNIERGDALIISHDMLRDDDGIFLDDTTVDDVSAALGMEVVPVYNDGYEFVEKILDEELF